MNFPLYEEIYPYCTHFGVETYAAEKVQKKIKNTRTRYTRETKSEKRKSGEGLDDVYLSKQPHYGKLKFLDDFITENRVTRHSTRTPCSTATIHYYGES